MSTFNIGDTVFFLHFEKNANAPGFVYFVITGKVISKIDLWYKVEAENSGVYLLEGCCLYPSFEEADKVGKDSVGTAHYKYEERCREMNKPHVTKAQIQEKLNKNECLFIRVLLEKTYRVILPIFVQKMHEDFFEGLLCYSDGSTDLIPVSFNWDGLYALESEGWQSFEKNPFLVRCSKGYVELRQNKELRGADNG